MFTSALRLELAILYSGTVVLWAKLCYTHAGDFHVEGLASVLHCLPHVSPPRSAPPKMSGG